METHPYPKPQQHTWLKRLRIDLRVFIHLFPWRIAVLFVIAFLFVAFIFQLAYVRTYNDESESFSYIKALYAVMNMATFQISFTDLPRGTALDGFFVVVPLVSIPFLLMFGANLITILRVFFVRQERGQMWQQALAQTTPDPIIICGLGRIGYRIASHLHAGGYPVIGIEAIKTPLVDALIEKDMPIILGDIRNVDVLRDASVQRAKQVLICTHDDLTNIMAANHIREMNENAELILRLFDDTIADELQAAFKIKSIISRSAVAAQAFAYAALGLEVLETFNVGDKIYALAEIPIRKSHHDKRTLQAFTQDTAMTIVCLYSMGRFFVEPSLDTELCLDDILLVFTELGHLMQLNQLTNIPQSHIIVCGIGHTGFRIVNALLALGQTVYALDFKANDLTEQLIESGVQVMYGDYRKKTLLTQAEIHQASALISCSENDKVNMEVVIQVRGMSPTLRLIARMFEEALGRHLQQAFNIDVVYSTSELAAPAFVTAVVNLHLTQPVNLGNDDYIIARLVIQQHTAIHNWEINKLNQFADTTVLLHRRGEDIYVPPHVNMFLQPDDEIVVLTTQMELDKISV